MRKKIRDAPDATAKEIEAEYGVKAKTLYDWRRRGLIEPAGRRRVRWKLAARLAAAGVAPTTTMLGVVRLAIPGQLVELDGIAVD